MCNASRMVSGLLMGFLLIPGSGAMGYQGDGTVDTGLSARAEPPWSGNLTITPEEASKIMYIEPNQTKAANLTVRNPADENDTVILNISAALHGKPGGIGNEYNGTGWKVWLELLSLELGGNRSRNVKVTVRGPKTGQPNDFIDVTVNATSRLDPNRNETVWFRIYLTFTIKLALECADKVHQAGWGGTTYRIGVRNPGQIDTGVILNVTGPPDWDCHLDVYCLTLEPNETAMVTLTVIPPDFAQMDEVGVVTVTGRSARCLSVKDSVITHTIACMCLWWELAAPNPEALVDPGERHVFALHVSNYGNYAGELNISFSLNLSSPDWTAALSTDLVNVAGGETKTVNLSVKAPADADAGSRLLVRVIGRCPKGYTEDCTFSAIVNQVHAVNVMSSPQTVELLPGGTAACDIIVYNNGNGDEKLRPEITAAPEGLDLVLSWPDGTIVDTDDWADLDARDHFNWRLVLSAAPGCIAGEYILPAIIRSVDNSTLPFGLGYRVLRTFGLDLRTAEPRQTLAPGGRAVFTLVCENTGNGPENVMFSVSGLPAGWQTPLFSVRDNDIGGRMTLDPFGQVRFAVELAVLPTATCGTVELSLTAFSHSASSDPVRLFIDVRMPNLLISRVHYFPHTLRLNRETTITVTIWNTGDIAAENITVRFYDNNKTAGNDRLARLPAGSNLTVTFIWLPQGGMNELKFVVDPDNLIIESYEQDNTVIERDVVYNPPDYREPPVELYLVPVALLLLVVAALFVLRRKS